MSVQSAKGARRVGWLADLSPAERAAVRCLRACGRSAQSETQLSADLAMSLGPDRARNTKAVLVELMQCAQFYGRRPLCRHACACECLGADEAVFAALVNHALAGEQEEATVLSALLVRPDMAQAFSGLVIEFSFAMALMAQNAPTTPPVTHPAQSALH